MTRRTLFFLAPVAGLMLFFGGWAATYPGSYDPKCISYVLWKAGVWKMNLDTATEVMVGDAGREKLVIGKSIPQLRERFGYLEDLSQTDGYNRLCHQLGRSSEKVLFLRRSRWMVVFDGSKATDLVLCKGS